MTQYENRGRGRTPTRERLDSHDVRLAAKAAQFYVRKLPDSNLWSGDGIDHINLSHYGETELGTALAASSPLRFSFQEFGGFDHLAGFYYFIATGAKYPHFRTKEFHRAASMFHAKAMNKEVLDTMEWQTNYLFMTAMWKQIRQYPKLMESIKASTLPFDCYNRRSLGQKRMGLNFLMVEGMERIRTYLKSTDGERHPEFAPFMMGHSHAEIVAKYQKAFLAVKEELVEVEGEQRRNGLLEAAIEVRGRRRTKTKAVPMALTQFSARLKDLQQLFLMDPTVTMLREIAPVVGSTESFLEHFFQQLPWGEKPTTASMITKLDLVTLFVGWVLNTAVEEVTEAVFTEMAAGWVNAIDELEPRAPEVEASRLVHFEEELKLFQQMVDNLKETNIIDSGDQQEAPEPPQVEDVTEPEEVDAEGVDALDANDEPKSDEVDSETESEDVKVETADVA